MFDDFDNFCWPASANLSIYSFGQIQSTTDQLPSPALISETVVPEIFASKRRHGLDSIPNEASSSMAVHGQKKRYKQMMRVPKRFIGLLPNLLMRRGVYEKHAKKHDMACYSTSLSIVDLNSCLFAKLYTLDVEKVDIMTCSVHYCPEK